MHKNQKGFTLLELMVVIAIIGTLSAIAVPNGIRFLNESKARSDVRNVLGVIQGARFEAIKNNQSTVIVFNVDADAESYIAFIENCGADDQYDPTCGDILINSQQMRPGSNLYTNLNLNALGFDRFGFDSRGIPILLPTTVTPAVFIQSSTNRFFRVTISPLGVIKTEESPNGTTNWN